jgi:hypothetical protein
MIYTWQHSVIKLKVKKSKQKFLKMPKTKKNESYKKQYTDRDVENCLRDIQIGKYFFFWYKICITSNLENLELHSLWLLSKQRPKPWIFSRRLLYDRPADFSKSAGRS